MTTLNNSKHKAKKAHLCNFCGLPIEVGEIYNCQSCVHEGDFYVWKTHPSCDDIAEKLNMFDNCDDGLTEEFFIEDIKNEYRDIMSNQYNEIYEAKGFVYPLFKEQLEFVKTHRL